MPERPASFSASRTSTLVDWSAGTSPNTTPVTSASPNVKTTTRTSTAMVSARGSVGPTSASRTGTANDASSRPAAPPAIEISRLSASR